MTGRDPPPTPDTETIWSVYRLAPVPALLEDAAGCIADVNEAFARWFGAPAETLAGLPVSSLVPADDRSFFEASHQAARQALAHGAPVTPVDRRLADPGGAERWCRIHIQHGVTGTGSALLWLLQDIAAEQRAEVHAERAIQELGQWFDLSPAGQVVFDASGLVLRSNAAFERLVDGVPVALSEAPWDLQRLLGWHDGALRPDLRPGLPVIETQCERTLADGRVLRLVGHLRAHAADDGLARVLALVVDRSAELERDLARLEMGALMSAAGVGVATYEAPGPAAREVGIRPGGDTHLALPWALQGLDDGMIEPASRAAYQRLQEALAEGRSAEVRFAVQHPQLGLRWLLSRVDPARLRSGRTATSVVTLDVTEQEESRQLGNELLRELTTILDASPVGIAYLRAGRLVRCNRRFERMLGFEPGAAAGVDFEQLFEWRAVDRGTVQAAVQAVRQRQACDLEMPLDIVAGTREWLALSVRGAESDDAGSEVVAVLSDITGLKRQQLEIERALHERELMFNQSDVGIAWVRAGRILRTNPAMSDLTGLAPDALEARALSSLYAGTAEERAAVSRASREALAARGRYSGELQLLRSDGLARWMQVAVRAVVPADPQSDWICTFVDVDERRRAREALQQQASRTRAMLDSVLVGIVTVGAQGIEWMNRSARRMFAGELDDFRGEPIGTVATDEPDHPLARPNWLQRLDEGQSETFECRLKARDGREFWVVGNAVATPADPDGERQITFVLLDIEARRQAEARITSARASLQRLIETAPLAIALFDADSQRVVECNQAAEAFFGQAGAELLRQTPEGFLADAAEAAALRASLQMARETPDGVRREITRPGARGVAQRWDTRFVSLDVPSTPAGAPSQGQILLVANDVTELRVAEQARLDAAIAQREMLVKEVHHRIKNNLQGVAGLLQQTAERRPALRTELMEAIGQVQAIAQVYGLQVGADGPLGLAGVLGAVAGSVQRSLRHVIDVRVQGDAGRWFLPEAESIPLALTLNELLTNAIKHGGEAAVRCVLHARDEDVLIEIVNSGALPPGFDLRLAPSGMYGLGLVRALLPRRAAVLDIATQGSEVVTSLVIRPPSVRRLAA